MSECEASGPDPDLLDRLAECPVHRAPYYACIINAERRLPASRDAEIARLRAELAQERARCDFHLDDSCEDCQEAGEEARRALEGKEAEQT